MKVSTNVLRNVIIRHVRKISFKRSCVGSGIQIKKNRAQPDSCHRPTCPAAGHLAEPKGTLVDTFTDAKIDTRATASTAAPKVKRRRKQIYRNNRTENSDESTSCLQNTSSIDSEINKSSHSHSNSPEITEHENTEMTNLISQNSNSNSKSQTTTTTSNIPHSNSPTTTNESTGVSASASASNHCSNHSSSSSTGYGTGPGTGTLGRRMFASTNARNQQRRLKQQQQNNGRGQYPKTGTLERKFLQPKLFDIGPKPACSSRNSNNNNNTSTDNQSLHANTINRASNLNNHNNHVSVNLTPKYETLDRPKQSISFNTNMTQNYSSTLAKLLMPDGNESTIGRRRGCFLNHEKIIKK